jgi:hypothetical protein
MKSIFLVLLSFFAISVKAQSPTFEIKVVSKKYQTVKGLLEKVSPEGIGVADYKGNYITFRPNEITRLKIRKRGLTVGEATLAGLGAGAGLGAAIWSLDENGNSTKEMLMLTAGLAGTGVIAGAITGVISEIVNTKFTLVVNENPENYKAGYKKLEKYVNGIITEHVRP